MQKECQTPENGEKVVSIKTGQAREFATKINKLNGGSKETLKDDNLTEIINMSRAN